MIIRRGLSIKPVVIVDNSSATLCDLQMISSQLPNLDIDFIIIVIRVTSIKRHLTKSVCICHVTGKHQTGRGAIGSQEVSSK